MSRSGGLKWLPSTPYITYLLFAVTYGAWIGATLLFENWGYWLLPLGALTVAMHSSLQHEAIHGHPSQRQWVNNLLGSLALIFYLPYGVYKETHFTHHQANITDPHDDPESFFVDSDCWSKHWRPIKGLYLINQTLIGRLILGPFLVVFWAWQSELLKVIKGDWGHVKHWLVHIFIWSWLGLYVFGYCGLSVVDYLLVFALPGLSLNLLRSYVEHRPLFDDYEGPPTPAVSATVESGPFFWILFLGNNFHELHHRFPHWPWYQLVHYQLTEKPKSTFTYKGYGEIFRRYALHPRFPVSDHRHQTH